MDLYTPDLTIEGMAALLSLVGFFGTLFLFGNEKKEKRNLLLLFALFFIIALSDGVFRVLNGKENAGFAVMVFRSLSEAAGVWFLGFTGVYISLLSDLDKKKRKVYYAVCLSVAGALSVLLSINLFTGFLFSVDVEGFLFHKKAFFLIYLLEGLLLTFDNEVYLMDVNELPDKIKPFVLSLFRYLRRAFSKATPSWIDRSNA